MIELFTCNLGICEPNYSLIDKVVTYGTYLVTVASIIANLPFIPHKDQEEAKGFLGKVSKLLNFLALNFKKIK
jgi:hypothetical protein